MSGEKGKAKISAVCPACQNPILAEIIFHQENGKNDGCTCGHCQGEYHVSFHDPKDGHLGLFLTPKMPVTQGQAVLS